jgi:hypothetical protein
MLKVFARRLRACWLCSGKSSSEGKDFFISPKEASNLLDGVSFLILESIRLTRLHCRTGPQRGVLAFSCSVITDEGCVFT